MRSFDERGCCEDEPFTEAFGIHHKAACENRSKLSPESARLLAEILSSGDEPIKSNSK